MPKPVHAQSSAVLTEGRREITAGAADLCRKQPAVLASVVREADRLRAQGVSDEDALALALDARRRRLTDCYCTSTYSLCDVSRW